MLREADNTVINGKMYLPQGEIRTTDLGKELKTNMFKILNMFLKSSVLEDKELGNKKEKKKLQMRLRSCERKGVRQKSCKSSEQRDDSRKQA